MAETRKDTKTAKTNNFPWKVIIGIIATIVIIIGAICVILQISKPKNESGQDDASSKTSQTLENGKGQKLDAEYVSLTGYNYKVLAPADFTKMNAEQIAADYGTSDAPDLVFTNKDNTVNLTLSKPENALSDSQIPEYLDAVKQTFDSVGAEVVDSKLYELSGYTIGEIELITDYTGDEIYNHMIFFSYDGKLAIISFNCLDSIRDEWSKVGDEIMQSLVINN